MNKYPDFSSFLIGKGPLGLFLGCVFVCYLCALISMLYDLANRDVASANTPVKTSWKFFSINNLLRIVVNILLIPVFIRVVYVYVDNMILLFIVCAGIGAGVDQLALIFKKMGVLTTNKLSQKIADKLAPDQPIVIPPTNKNQ